MTTTRTFLTVVERTCPKHRSNYILHDGWQWYHADFNSEETMMDLLKFFECEIEEVETHYNADTGKWTCYNVSKDIISRSCGGFWTLDQAMKEINGRRYKAFLGLSNGAIVTCYAVFNDDDTVEILRPNPNAKEVYNKMRLKEELAYRRNHWYL